MILTLLLQISLIGIVNAQQSPTVVTDKADYAPEETVIITGSGFTPGASYDVPVIRPNGSIVLGNGLFQPGWDTVQADELGAFTYSYILDGIVGCMRCECTTRHGAAT